MSNKSRIFAIVLALLSSISLIAVILGLGVFIGSYFTLNKYICITAFILDVLLLLIFVLNIIRAKINTKQLKKKNGQEIYAAIFAKKEEAFKNIDKSYQSIIKSYKHATIYMLSFYAYQLLLLLFNGVIIFSCKALGFVEACIPAITILSLFLFSFILAIFNALFLNLFSNTKIDIDYPLIHQFVKQICLEEGVKKEIEVIIFSDDVNVSISEDKHKIRIAISTFILKFFTKDEIKSILYHELAHYKQEHTKLARTRAKYRNLSEILLPNDLYLFIYPKFVNIVFNNEMLQYLLTIYYETKADDEVLKKNVGQTYATTAVKLFGLSYALRLSRNDIEYLLCKNLSWTEEIIDKLFSGYLSFYSQHQDFFIFASKHHLVERMPTHPNVKQRVDKFASNEVDPTILPSTDFDEDILKYYQKLNQLVFTDVTKDTNNDFIKDYEKFLQDKENAIKINFNMESKDLLSLLDQADNYGDMELARDCAQKMLSLENEDSTRAHFILGMVKAFYEFSDDCIEHLLAVYHDKNSQFSGDAFLALGEYTAITGKEELLNSLREEVPTTYDEHRELEDVMSLNQNDTLKPFTNEEVIQHIIDIVKENDEIEKVCIGTKESKNTHCHQVILFGPSKPKNIEKINDTRYQVWLYLDLDTDFYNLTLLSINALPRNHKFKKKPLCVYTKNK